jgi:hypothetical protein
VADPVIFQAGHLPAIRFNVSRGYRFLPYPTRHCGDAGYVGNALIVTRENAEAGPAWARPRVFTGMGAENLLQNLSHIAKIFSQPMEGWER